MGVTSTFLWILLILVLIFGFLFVITVLNDYLIYRDLMRRLRKEREEEN